MQSLETRVTVLEQKVEQLEHVFAENNKILESTHGVVSLALNEQRDKFKELKKDITRLEDKIDKNSEQIKQLELLIRQFLNLN